MINQLIELWHGIDLLETFEHSNEKTIKDAIIYYSCNISAAKKLYKHISVRITCHRCNKHASFDNKNQLNFGGLADMNSWFVKRNVKEIKSNTLV